MISIVYIVELQNRNVFSSNYIISEAIPKTGTKNVKTDRVNELIAI